MRYVISFLVCYCAFSVATSRAAIDLNPTLSEFTAEGIAYKQLVFKDGTRQIAYELPSQWRYRSSADSVKLLPPNDSTADAVIKAVPLTAPRPLDDKGIAAVRDHFMNAIPPTAQNVNVVSESLNTVPLKVANCEITATYQAFGEVFTRRALYLNLPDTHVIFRLTARKNEFEGLWRTLRGSILSWQWIEPAIPAGPRTASK